MKNKKIKCGYKALSLCLIGIMLCMTCHVTSYHVKAATAIGYEWKRNDTMDELLQTISNKAGDDEALLTWDMDKYGIYELEYFLKDDTKTRVTFEHEVDKVTVRYSIITESTSTNITSTEAAKSYAEMDYSLMVPTLKTVDPATVLDGGELKYVITRGASSKYPGVAFIINNMPVRFRWDMQTKKMNFLTKGIPKGYIIDFRLTDPDTINENIQLLRALDNFEITPSHWVNDGGNMNLDTIILPPGTPNDTKPGSKPGLTISFDRPKVLGIGNIYDYAGDVFKNTGGDTIKAIVTLKDIKDNGNNTDIIFDFDAPIGGSGTFTTTPTSTSDNSTAQYTYNAGKYTIELVKDRAGLQNGSTDFLQWDDLEASRVYIASINLESSVLYEFHDYEPVNEYAYTYLDYEVKRASMDDAYLDIAPYAGSNADDLEYTIYHKKADAVFTDDNIWLKHYHNQQNLDNNIYIPVPFKNGSSQEFYKVGVQFAGTKLDSQTIHYQPINDTNVPPPVPKVKAIKNLAVVPPDDVTSNEPNQVQFDLEWYAPSKTLLDQMLANAGDVIYYEFQVNDIPQVDSTNPYEIIKVFRVWKDGSDIKVEEVNTGKTPGTPTNAIGAYNAFGYNERDGLFEVQNIVIKDTIGWSKPVVKDLTQPDPNKYTEALAATDPYNYEYPGINFIRMKSVYIKAGGGGIGESDRSIADSLSLSMIKYDIPIVDNLAYIPRITSDTTPKVGMNVTFKLADVSNYENFMLAPIGKGVNNMDYRVYISQDKQKILNLDNTMTTDDPGNIMNILDLVDPARLTANGIHKINIAGDDLELTSTEIDPLRNNDILYYDINKGPAEAGVGEMKLLNLDPNTNYYVRVVTRLNIHDVGDTSTIIETRRSEPSTMLSATSPVVPSEPGENELIPLAPEDMEVKHYDDNNLTGEISWSYPDEITFEKDKYGFELMSIENKALPSSLATVLSMKDLIESTELTGTNMEAWRILVGDSGYELKYYNKTTDTWDTNTSFTFTVADNKITMIDGNNMPNKVYYYYARTIKIEGDVSKGASAWVGDTLTTAPIKRPINLIVAHNSSYSYDEKLETIIRFDAPVPSDFHTTGDYIMQVFVKADKDVDYTNNTYTYTYLGQEEGANDGYTRMYYKISNLKPGTTYSIKVRVEDRTMPMETLPNGTQVYPLSSFSERVTTRTDFDQVDYDKEQKYLQYIQYYLDKAQELKNTPIWLIEEKDTLKVVKYRGEMNIGELKYVSDGKYYLESAIEGITQIYIPAKMIQTANDNSITIMTKFPEGEFGIRPYAVSQEDTQAIKDMITRINQYNNVERDYYIRLDVTIGKYNDKVEGYKPLTQLLVVDIQIVGSSKSETDFDLLALSKFDAIVNGKKAYLIEQLEKELESGIDESKLLKIVQDTLKLVQEDHRVSVKSLMTQYIQKEYTSLKEVDNSLHIAFGTQSQVDDIQGYKKDNHKWKRVDGYYFNQQYTMDTSETGAYLLAPRSSLYNQLDDDYNGMVTDLVNTYKLTEIFNGGELSEPDSKVYGYQIIAAIARILGSPDGHDTDTWLMEQGIRLPALNPYAYITKEEAYYLLVQAYSMKNSIPLQTMVITDYNSIEDYSSITITFRDTLLRGVNYGIIPMVNGQLKPQDNVDMETVLEILTRIENKIDW
ncbi:hypothetical protein HZI73_00465 [Vallitalea pronyensis]|uniref:Fibronectin type-III domain-containing protein n=1 Tax=Vallitalea pronyensis TaxID=1348613 RepID=A0A8J8MGM2_9FIRM|nr:hypothetical protein [Vallitalea pronyensis]QUI20873.1 hypothetical protein HZI73_00465 [Vallitalea pronyensis]